jgi:hypothetical protein
VTAKLAERFPDYVQAPLAVEPEHGWFLLSPFEEIFDWNARLGARRDALRRFAGLQRRTAELIPELLGDGCLEPAAKPELDATHTFLREVLSRTKGL